MVREAGHTKNKNGFQIRSISEIRLYMGIRGISSVLGSFAVNMRLFIILFFKIFFLFL